MPICLHRGYLYLTILFSVGCNPTSATGVETLVTLEGCARLNITGESRVQITRSKSDHSRARLVAPRPLVINQDFKVEEGVFELTPKVPVSGTVYCDALQSVSGAGRSEITVDENAPGGARQIRAYGDSRVAFHATPEPVVEVRSAGRSRLLADHIDGDDLRVMASGRSRLVLKGMSSKLFVTAGGDSEIDASELRAQNVALDARGSARVSLWATAHLRQRLRGNAELDVSGTPDVSHWSEANGSRAGVPFQ